MQIKKAMTSKVVPRIPYNNSINISRNINAVLFKLGTRYVNQKRNIMATVVLLP